MSVVLSGLSSWPHGQDCQAIPESVFFLALILQKLFHRSNRVVVFARIGLALPIVNKCSRKMRIISITHHHSLLLNNFQESHHFVHPGVKVSCFLIVMVLSNSAVLLPFFRSFEFCNENLQFKFQYGLVFSCLVYACFLPISLIWHILYLFHTRDY
jgi:hypothetical protein